MKDAEAIDTVISTSESLIKLAVLKVLKGRDVQLDLGQMVQKPAQRIHLLDLLPV